MSDKVMTAYRMKKLIKAIKGYIYTVKVENGVAVETYHGEGCAEITGYTSEDFRTDPDLWFQMVHEDDREAVKKQAAKALAGEEQSPLEHRILHRDGSVRWVKGTIVLNQDKQFRLNSYDGLITNISVRKSAEEALRESEQRYKRLLELAESRRQKLVQADKLASLGILVAGMAHEINNPNNYILLNAKFLSRGWREVKPILDEYAARHGDFILGGLSYLKAYDKITRLFEGLVDGSQRIQKIVQSLKDFAREDGRGAKELMDLNKVVEASITIVQTLIKKCTNNFSVCTGKNIPKIMGNFQQLEQVLINLITNSCQALQRQQARLWIETVYDAEKNDVVARVIDEGLGISEPDLKRIFDPFFTTKRDSGGTGLGLAISYRIVKDHGGELNLKSQLGQGTTAIVTLPVAS